MTGETYSTDGAECPYCNQLTDPADDNYSLYSEETCEWKCGACEHEFRVSVYVSHSWICEKKEPKL